MQILQHQDTPPTHNPPQMRVSQKDLYDLEETNL